MKRYTGETAWRHAKIIGQRYDRYVSPYAMAGCGREEAEAYLLEWGQRPGLVGIAEAVEIRELIPMGR